MSATGTHRAIEAVWRIEAAKLIAGLARMTRDVGAAEDLAQEALLQALERWPETGIPDRPGAEQAGFSAEQGILQCPSPLLPMDNCANPRNDNDC